MKQKQLLRTLLAAVCLLVGTSAWAETETLTLYSQDYEEATDASSWGNGGVTLSLATDNTNYISAVSTGSPRYCYTNFYSTTDFYGDYTAYQLTFDAALTKSNNQEGMFVVMADGHKMPGSVGKNYLQIGTGSNDYSESENAHLLLIRIPTNGTATIKGDEDKTFTADGTWMTFTLDVTSTSVNYAIVNRETKASIATGTYTLPTGTSYKASGLFSFLGRYANTGKAFIDNIKVTTEVEAGSIETPTAAITAVNGTTRTVTFACVTDGVTLSYSTDGGSSFTTGTSLDITENTTIIVKATKGGNSVQSEPIEFEAGTKITLNVPTVSVSALTQKDNGLYYPTVNASYTPAGVLLTPSATVTAKFNGSAVSLPFAATTSGTLVVTASYEGYESAEYEYNVVGYAKVTWKDYTTLESLSGRPSGLRKWSGDDHWALAEGYGLEAVRTDGNAWAQIDKSGMVAYDVLSEASSTADKSTIILVNNSNAGNDSFQYFTNGKVLSKIYYFTEGISAPISEYGYATFSSTKPVNVDVEGLEAYVVTGKNGSSITTEKITGDVAANTGLILKGNAGTYGLPVVASGTTYNQSSDPKNYLFACDGSFETVNAATTGTNYVLTVQEEKVVFAPIGTTPAPVKAGQAALWLQGESGPAKALALSLGDDVTGIEAVSTVEPQGAKTYYNLQGQRVSEPKQGIYVVDGKKVLVK